MHTLDRDEASTPDRRSPNELPTLRGRAHRAPLSRGVLSAAALLALLTACGAADGSSTNGVPPSSPDATVERQSTTNDTDDPSARSGADQELPTSRTTHVGVEQFLGTTTQDESFTNYLAAHRCFAALGNWNCQETSTEFALDTDSRVVGIIMKAPGVATAEGYEGALPAEITFDDTPEELVAKLGRPIAGSAKPGSFLKWDGGQVALFVNFFNSTPLRVADVRLALSN